MRLSVYICFIVALLALFVIIDYKEFSFGSNTAPSERNVVENESASPITDSQTVNYSLHQAESKNVSLNRSNLSQNNYACRQLKKRQIG